MRRTSLTGLAILPVLALSAPVLAVTFAHAAEVSAGLQAALDKAAPADEFDIVVQFKGEMQGEILVELFGNARQSRKLHAIGFVTATMAASDVPRVIAHNDVFAVSLDRPVLAHVKPPKDDGGTSAPAHSLTRWPPAWRT